MLNGPRGTIAGSLLSRLGLGSDQGATVCHSPASDAPLWCSQQSVQWRLKQKCGKFKFRAGTLFSASADGTGFHIFVRVPSERRPWFRGITVSSHIVLLEAKRLCQECLPLICGRLGVCCLSHIASVRFYLFNLSGVQNYPGTVAINSFSAISFCNKAVRCNCEWRQQAHEIRPFLRICWRLFDTTLHLQLASPQERKKKKKTLNMVARVSVNLLEINKYGLQIKRTKIIWVILKG